MATNVNYPTNKKSNDNKCYANKKNYHSFLISIILIYACGVECMAQINSKPSGIKLGGTRSEIKTFLAENDYAFSTTNTKYGPAYCVNDIYFLDFKWDIVIINFYESQCALVSFVKQSNSELGKILLFSTYSDILENLSDKYSKYSVEHKGEDDSVGIGYNDGKTSIQLEMKVPDVGAGYINLNYANEALMKKVMSHISNDF